MLRMRSWMLILLVATACQSSPQDAGLRASDGLVSAATTQASVDDRMDWWRDARFGMFIHWGLYSTLEGEWNGATGHAEWIRTTAQIPLEEYDKLQAEFNPVNYDADAWCRMAKAAGMKYVVITTKHHDGFCLWPSATTEFDVAGGPSGRDLLAELAEACRRHDLKLGWYHSIMDWHHPDYLPRRGWETGRSAEGADFDRYVEYLHAQVTELLSNYGPIDVMWFDGEWENTWTSEYGRELYALCRELQPQVLVNNRVDKGRAGMAGLDKGPGFVGDFGTPEQEVPAGGLPGVDWETCMTMNRYWGWNRADTEWKSTGELIHTLVDVASKGGNFLLNIGPKPDGSFPAEAQERLAGMGEWIDAFGESIYGTEASPFAAAFEWGRATLRSEADADESTLYLHVFDWPRTPQLIVPNLDGEILSAELLGTPSEYPLGWQKVGGGTQFFLPKLVPHPFANVVKVQFKGKPVVYRAPEIQAEVDRFVESTEVSISAGFGLRVHYTLDGSDPTTDSPRGPARFVQSESAIVSARSFWEGAPVSEVVRREFVKLRPRAGEALPEDALVGGLRAYQWDGAFEQVPEPLLSSQSPTDLGRPGDLRMTEARKAENQCIEQAGWLHVPATGLYQFALTSDDGSKLWVGDLIKDVVVDNDGLHGAATKVGYAALAKGWHPIRIVWFNRTGSGTLDLEFGLVDGPQQRPAPQAMAAN